MEVLVAVIDDLWRFAYSQLFGSVNQTKVEKELEVQEQLPFAVSKKSQTSLFETAELPMAELSNSDLRTGERYFVAQMGVYLYSDPVIAFDTAVQELSYGQTVVLKKVGGRWAEVELNGRSGWILKDAISIRHEDVKAHFLEGEFYDSHHNETIKLRASIDDEFGGARADLPLSSAEYVTYQLIQHHRHIDWETDSPRVPGSWQYKLRGKKGIYMNVLPKTHSVMEYLVEDIGHLAFVEAVFPDRSIKLSEVGQPEEGYYREVVLSQNEYIELKPVFISVS